MSSSPLEQELADRRSRRLKEFLERHIDGPASILQFDVRWLLDRIEELERHVAHWKEETGQFSDIVRLQNQTIKDLREELHDLKNPKGAK